MNIHEKARAAKEAVYDAEISRLSAERDELQASLIETRAELADATVEYDETVTALEAHIVTLNARIAELENTPQGIEVRPGGLSAAVEAAEPGATLILRRGNHFVDKLRLSKPVTIVGASGEEVWLDGDHRAQVSLIVAAENVTLRNFGVRNYDVLRDKNFGGNADAWNRGLIVTRPGAVLDGLRFSHNGHTKLAATTVRDFHAHALSIIADHATVTGCVFEDTGGSHIHSEKTTGLIIEDSTFTGANRLGVKMQPVTSAMKLTRAANATVRRNVIRDVPQAGGIWLDVDCTNALIYLNDIEAGYEQIEIELSDGAIIAYNTVRGVGTGTYNIRALDSKNVRIWHNTVIGAGTEHIQIAALADDRATQWPTSGVEIVNNVISGGFRFGAVGAYDMAGKTGATGMVSRVAGNKFEKETVYWGTSATSRGGRTLDQMIQSHPNVFSRGEVPTPEEIRLLGVA